MSKCSHSSVSRMGQKERYDAFPTQHVLSLNYTTSFFNDNTLSDVTIKFGCESIQAHKVILAQGSDYFKKMFCRSFKAGLLYFLLNWTLLTSNRRPTPKEFSYSKTNPSPSKP